MDYIGWIIGIIGIVFGVISFFYTKMQLKSIKNIENRTYRISWDLAKSGQYLLERVEKLKPYLDNNDSSFSLHYGRIHQQCINLINNCLQNVFLSNKPISDYEERKMKDSDFLSGYLCKAYNQMKINLPESWEPKNEY